MFAVAHALCRTSLEQGLKVTLTTKGRCLGEELLAGGEGRGGGREAGTEAQRGFQPVVQPASIPAG